MISEDEFYDEMEQDAVEAIIRCFDVLRELGLIKESVTRKFRTSVDCGDIWVRYQYSNINFSYGIIERGYECSNQFCRYDFIPSSRVCSSFCPRCSCLMKDSDINVAVGVAKTPAEAIESLMIYRLKRLISEPLKKAQLPG